LDLFIGPHIPFKGSPNGLIASLSLWEDQDWRFKRSQETLHMEEFSSQVRRQVIWRRRPKNDKIREIGSEKLMPCA